MVCQGLCFSTRSSLLMWITPGTCLYLYWRTHGLDLCMTSAAGAGLGGRCWLMTFVQREDQEMGMHHRNAPAAEWP